ncbi:MAG TPA: response regulator transcription factor [Candidatus Eisenbacteria bacterium]|nr:response regulator transcription factor [Candidatus Eisenbacteria bacterium]
MCPHAQMNEDATIRCTLAHDMVWLRQGLRRLLEDQPDMTVVAEAGNAAEALRSILEHRPEVAIVDWHLFDSALGAEQMILQDSPSSKVVFLSTTEKEVPQGADAGYCAVRDTSAEELVRMVRAAAGRNLQPVPRSSENSVREFIPRNRILTAREREVLKLLAEGRTVRSVAGVLGLSIKTVDAHKFNLMRKLGIHNKAELVMWAIQKKMVKVPVNF